MALFLLAMAAIPGYHARGMDAVRAMQHMTSDAACSGIRSSGQRAGR